MNKFIVVLMSKNNKSNRMFIAINTILYIRLEYAIRNFVSLFIKSTRNYA